MMNMPKAADWRFETRSAERHTVKLLQRCRKLFLPPEFFFEKPVSFPLDAFENKVMTGFFHFETLGNQGLRLFSAPATAWPNPGGKVQLQ